MVRLNNCRDSVLIIMTIHRHRPVDMAEMENRNDPAVWEPDLALCGGTEWWDVSQSSAP